jgi:WD40 repeat protein
MDDGAHDIVSFCLGHEKFVSSCSFIIDSDNKKELILTGGGDGLIKLWNPNTGDELDSKNVSGPILDMVASEEQSKCFVILDGSTEVVVVSVKDTMIHVVRQEIGIPAVTGVDVSDDGTTWFVGGPIGHSHGMRLMCMRWTDGTAESIDLIDQMREIENCTTDDKPLYLNHLPEYMEKKPRIFNK